ncbi:SDR family oxidoreductase [Pelagerythrobacter sp.]|uniref:SDR family oxidoreductase n=1 Tax=Pelagerythrobacter sp. TaxID=2800702 RepID=UPI0035B37132
MSDAAPPRPAVLVTGGAKRLGAAIARAFGEAGWHVVIHYGSSRDEAEALAAALPSAETVRCDLADGDAAVAMVEALSACLPDWRVLANCAAIFDRDSVTELDSATYLRAMQVNSATPARMAQAFLAHARAAGGRRVIQFTDQKLANPNPDFPSYTMSKHAVAAMVPMLAQPLDEGGAAHPGDRVYALAPGAILPSHDQSEDEAEVSHRLNLLKRRTGAEEIAQACLWLAQGWLASGETLFVDSGQHLLAQPRDVIYLAREGVSV